eukprot:TRINITY_DN738_c0_g1_i4.p1 TRINITY_DN738_c0_g1~~TRINITY_DN738_c0_g1_i4.p1  ORF type:complete len:127 (-),score=15.02 TRINITY_DN738_c0_g1_i4:135-515(-)
MVNWNLMRQFGVVHGSRNVLGSRPKTPIDWFKLYQQHKKYIFGVKKITVQWAQSGPGHAGIRHFQYYQAPPIIFWNKDIEWKKIKLNKGQPSLTVEFTNGTKKSIDVLNKHSDEITRLFESIVANK